MAMLFDKDTIKLLRIPFSFFLMPVFFLALSQVGMGWNLEMAIRAVVVFLVLHLFIYPASNGYNSYMDQDEGSIGGIKHPPKATKNLFYASILFDFLGLGLSLWIGLEFFLGILAYMVVSRAYSYKGIRLKRFPVIGFLSVIIFQGAITFMNVYMGITGSSPVEILQSKLILPMLASSLMIGGVYPLTQIYQHEQDKLAGDITISYMLGYRGTFVFSILLFLGAGGLLFGYFPFEHFLIFQVFLFPVVIYFLRWFVLVWKETSHANFENTMRMNLIASICMNSCFLVLFILNLV
ncbi:MAG: UbiA family prenyltransferase [Cytophagales bacterium]|nr:UbiA family prenyltransferase [Cytophagales bacterium]